MDEGASSSTSTTITTTPPRYWCHCCTNFVQPVLDSSEQLQCPTCQSGFIEQISQPDGPGLPLNATEMWAPLLVNLIHGNSQPAQSPPQYLRPFFRNMNPRRRSRANRVLVIQERDGESQVGITMNEYLSGSGLEMLLQYISENGPAQNVSNPPAKKEDVEKMVRVKVEEITSCPVCMEDFELGEMVRKMPCNHMFHQECILAWLEMHSTCPVCRYQMPVEGTKEREAGTDEREEREERERFERMRRESRRNGEVAESSRSGAGESPRSRTRRFHGLFQRIVHRLRNNNNRNGNRSNDRSNDRNDDGNNDN